MSKKKSAGPSFRVAGWAAWFQDQGEPPAPVTEPAEAARAYFAAKADEPPPVDGDLAAALVHALVETDDAERLLACAEQGGKALAKAARKSLHGLRRRGEKVRESKQQSDRGRVTRQQASRWEDARATLSTPFGSGERICVFRFRGETDRKLYAGMVNLSDETGPKDVKLYTSGSKVYRTMVEATLERLCGAEVPFGRLLALFDEAEQASEAAGRMLPQGWRNLRQMIGDSGDLPRGYPADDFEPELLKDEAVFFELWQSDELRSWIPAKGVIDELRQAASETMESAIIIQDDQRLARLSGSLENALDASIDAPALARWRSRLEDAAWVARENQRLGLSKHLLAARRAISEAGDEAPRHIFFWQLAGRVLLDLLPQPLAARLIPGVPYEEEEEASSTLTEDKKLLWTPEDGDPEGGGPEDGGGLIIPGR